MIKKIEPRDMEGNLLDMLQIDGLLLDKVNEIVEVVNELATNNTGKVK